MGNLGLLTESGIWFTKTPSRPGAWLIIGQNGASQGNVMKPARRINEPSPDRSLNTEASKELYIEKHYSVSELASSWQLSENTIRRMFEDEPGVLRWGTTEGRFKRRYITLRIPETVVLRVHRQLRAAG